MSPQAIVYIIKALVQLGISVEQYREAVDNPDMTDEELAERIKSNTDAIEALKDN